MKNSKNKKLNNEKMLPADKTEDAEAMNARIEKFKQNACHDCGALPGEPHRQECDVERCSVCGGQCLQEQLAGNICKGHNPAFVRWTGFWPGGLEADALGFDMNTIENNGRRGRFDFNGVSTAETIERARELEMWQSDFNLISLFNNNKNNPLIRWKDSIQKVTLISNLNIQKKRHD